MKSVPQPWDWFKLQSHVNDSLANKFLCMTRWGNTRLGNRFPNRYGLKYDCCPAWERWGVTVQLNEAHVIFSCPVVSGQRLGLGLSDMGRGLSMCHEILQTFVGGDCAPCLYSWKGGVKWESSWSAGWSWFMSGSSSTVSFLFSYLYLTIHFKFLFN